MHEAVQPFKIHILGCGSATPTLRHSSSSQIVEIRGKLFMIDCAEGTQTRLRLAHIHFAAINNIFISHLHGDHCLGLFGMLSTFGLLGRTAPMHIYATAELKEALDTFMRIICPNLGYEVCFHPIDTTVCKTIYKDRSVSVSTLPLDHRVPCCGFLFKENPTLPHIRRDAIDAYGIPLSMINSIKRGSAYTTPEGDIIPNKRLTTPADPPRSYAYCSDTRYCPKLPELIRGVNVLYHESTYGKDCAELAAKFGHSTAGEAAMTARDAAVGRLVIGHFSARYEDESVLLNEAQEIFPRSVLANEMMVIDV